MPHLNQKDLRILKLHDKGLSNVTIAQKIGYSAPVIEQGVLRVQEALARAGILTKKTL